MSVDGETRPPKAMSQRAQRREWSAELRAQGSTWVEVADALADRYGVNPRVAFRLARDWSQRDAADQWNQRWPDDPKTFKNFSYWEQWPGSTGYAPSLDVLARLAELYQCSVADLVIDLGDHSHLDTAWAASGDLNGLWTSRYSYFSDSRDETMHSDHRIRLHHTGRRLHAVTDPTVSESRLTLDLSVDGAIATGTWSERTAPTGYYRGAVYHGTLQLVISPHARSMSGRWLGFGKDFVVNSGDWHLEWLEA
ncbi:putative DNA-binding protein [Nocardioidaceae bacterium Broad-1]|nr:putative DNA-binding protein [Nocardioidaceae bacterium Broad-1]